MSVVVNHRALLRYCLIQSFCVLAMSRTFVFLETSKASLRECAIHSWIETRYTNMFLLAFFKLRSKSGCALNSYQYEVVLKLQHSCCVKLYPFGNIFATWYFLKVAIEYSNSALISHLLF